MIEIHWTLDGEMERIMREIMDATGLTAETILEIMFSVGAAYFREESLGRKVVSVDRASGKVELTFRSPKGTFTKTIDAFNETA